MARHDHWNQAVRWRQNEDAYLTLLPITQGIPHRLTAETPDELRADIVTRARILTARYSLANRTIRNFLLLNGSFTPENWKKLHTILKCCGILYMEGGANHGYRQIFIEKYAPAFVGCLDIVFSRQPTEFGVLRTYSGIHQALTPKQIAELTKYFEARALAGIEFAPSPPVPLLPLRTP